MGIAERKTVRPALPGSIEELLHETGNPAFYVPTHDGSPPPGHLRWSDSGVRSG